MPVAGSVATSEAGCVVAAEPLPVGFAVASTVPLLSLSVSTVSRFDLTLAVPL